MGRFGDGGSDSDDEAEDDEEDEEDSDEDSDSDSELSTTFFFAFNVTPFVVGLFSFPEFAFAPFAGPLFSFPSGESSKETSRHLAAALRAPTAFFLPYTAGIDTLVPRCE